MRTSELWWERVVALIPAARRNSGEAQDMYCRALTIARMEMEINSALETIQEANERRN